MERTSSKNFFKSSQFDLSRKLLILGCGGHSKVVTEVAEAIGFNDINYLDKSNDEIFFLGRKIVQKVNENYNGYFFVAIGDNYLREKVYNQFLIENKLAQCITLVHPKSCVSFRSSIEEGTIIMPLSVVNSSTKVGKGVIINTSSTVDHDSILMDFCSLAPGVNIGGNVSVGIRSAISIGTSIKHGVGIGNDVVIGGSSLVLEDIDDNCLSFGIPSKCIRRRKLGEKYL